MEFKDIDLAAYYHGEGKRPRTIPPQLATRLVGKIDMLAAATSLTDLRIPPSNRLEKLRGDRDGCYSIRVNQQFRLVFTWTEKGVSDVEFVDYH